MRGTGGDWREGRSEKGGKREEEERVENRGLGEV